MGYQKLVDRYAGNVIDVKPYMTEEVLRNVRCDERPGNSKIGPGLWRDDCGHPNEVGYRFIQTVISDFFRRSRIDPEAMAVASGRRSSPREFVLDHVDAAQEQNFLARMTASFL